MTGAADGTAQQTAQGTAHKFGDNVNTDNIIPANYLMISDAARLAKHAMETAGNEEFLQKLQSAGVAGDYVVAGQDFGSGSSREHAPVVLKENGIAAVIAKSYSRIFRGNAINIGLILIECASAVNGIRQGDQVRVDYGASTIYNLTTDQIFNYRPLSDLSQSEKDIMAAGGRMPWAIKRAEEMLAHYGHG